MEASHFTRPVGSSKLVSVVIPAFNAGETIDRTLHSVRGQSHTNLEILVVDDGSTDETSAIVAQHALCDSRVHLITAPNGGVAAARNRGIAAASSDLIAPIDADDLWATDKIARQVDAMERGGPTVGLVYTWYANLDSEDAIIRCGPQPLVEGWVLPEMAERNLVGNGSSPLIRREAILRAGGYDPNLRAQRAQGCEDWKLYLAVAEQWEYRVVPDFLTGYRRSPGNMSSDVTQMLRSADLVIADWAARRPDLAHRFAEGRKEIVRHLVFLSLRNGRWSAAREIAADMFRDDPTFASVILLRAALRGASAPFDRRPPAPPALLKRLERRFTPASAAIPDLNERPSVGETVGSTTAPMRAAP